ncbi:MAG: nickel-dependent lactate racemase [Bryobacteraceae bacterium]
MRHDFAFGRTGLQLDLPDGFQYQVLEARSAQPLADPQHAIEESLSYLTLIARGKRSAAISVCDITRPAPNKQTLPPILRVLAEAGIPSHGITILIATGLHRPATAAEIREIVGEEIAHNYKVVNHNARDLHEHTCLGATSSGTPVYVDSRFIAADLHITLGFIEPHLMLGFSGGRKLVAPGLAAQETIKVLHSPKFMRDARSSEGSIEDNPLHRELLEIARMARHDFLLDVALTRDRRIAGVFAGRPEEAHARGVAFVSQTMLERLDEPVDAVITTAAGYPLDLTYYQSIKGITAASHILKPNARLLLLAHCEEGCGAPEFSTMVMDGGRAGEFLDRLASQPVEVDQWQLEKLALVARGQNIFYYLPGLPPEYHPHLWGQSFSTAAAAVQALLADLPPQARIALISEGPYVLARVARAA